MTTAIVDVSVGELELFVTPFTKEELLNEAQAWQFLLQKKAKEIATAEIAVKKKNNEILKTKETKSSVEETRAQLEKATDEKQPVGDIQGKIEKVSAASKEAAKAEEETSDITSGLDRTRPEEANLSNIPTGIPNNIETQARQSVSEVIAKYGKLEGELDNVVQIMEAAEDATVLLDKAAKYKETDKIRLLERVNQLREERTGLIDRLNVVLDELESKTDLNDADTIAKMSDYRLYIRSVSGIQVDVQDTTSAWIAVKGWLVSDEGGLRWAKNLAFFVCFILVAWVLSKILSHAMHRTLLFSGGVSQLLEDFLVSSIRWVVWSVGIIMALAAMEVSIGPLLAVVGAAGFVIAFALQDSLSNFANGLMILFFRPFDVGDVVEAGGVSGTIKSMNLVSTTIKTFDNKDMLVPNNMIWNRVITNATGVTTRRVDMEFGIGYSDDIDHAQRILEEIVHSHPKVLKDPEPVIRIHTLADSSVNFICRPWSFTENYWEVYWGITKTVKKRFDEEGIGIPYPQRDVHLYIEDLGSNTRPLQMLSETKSNLGKQDSFGEKYKPTSDSGLDAV